MHLKLHQETIQRGCSHVSHKKNKGILKSTDYNALLQATPATVQMDNMNIEVCTACLPHASQGLCNLDLSQRITLNDRLNARRQTMAVISYINQSKLKKKITKMLIFQIAHSTQRAEMAIHKPCCFYDSNHNQPYMYMHTSLQCNLSISHRAP